MLDFEQIVMFMPCTRVYLSGLISGKHELFVEAQAVVAVAVERLWVQAAEVAHAGQRERNQAVEELVHAGRRSVTLQPMSMPSRSRKAAMLFVDLHRTGFWPVISAKAAVASSMCFLSVIALPTPMLTTILSSRGKRKPILATRASL